MRNLIVKIAIASGKGGTGKTFISTNLFNVLQKQEMNLALVDCDAEEPNAKLFLTEGKLKNTYEVNQKVPVVDESKCTYCGKCAEYCNYNAIFFLKEAKVINVLEDLCHGCGACSVACSYSAISEKNNLLGYVNTFEFSPKSALIEARIKVGVYSSVNVIKAAIKKASDFNLVLFDAPPGTGCPFIQTVVQADYVVLVTEPTPYGLSDLKQSIETLKGMNKSYGVIINKAGLGDEKIYDYLNKENIPLLMSVPFDKNIAVSYSKGELLTDLNSEWEEKFSQLYNTIREEYGNSSN
ncbi:MAG: ATP-binding protein [Paludibacteraceae bacterium]|jgi:MinD superfamily P-loop ATPase|nr:ATP-binding protein [Paludibacteraceae bacterium]OQC34335.1 MAG: 2-ketoisovalerate ferredoxin oxidoreductase subunit delta [Bacteroidetes bacterium ADurb.Bin057]HHT60792.1 P-loop NTPase [Bacteroidales bacterium]MBP9040002.1 ATP-binding protein [Paludibacteraceae bacterium]HOG36392.1 ATP-binding protein [Paludibacteraceae bacterium]